MTAARARWLRSTLTFQPGEGRRVAIMILYSAAAIGGVLTLGLAASEALFVAQLPSTDIPFTFILPATAIIPALYLYNRLSRRVRYDRLIITADLLLLAIIGLFRLLLSTAFGKSLAVLGGFYLTIELSYTLVILQFWIVAGRVFDVREAKRLFGLIALGGTVTNILVGLSMRTLANLIGVDNFLIIVMIALAICAACVWRVTRLAITASNEFPVSTAKAAVATPASFNQDQRSLWRLPLLRAIGGLTLLLSLLINIGAYMFRLSLQAAFSGRPSELAGYLGGYEFLAGLAAIVVQFYLTSRIMRRFGVLTALLFFPAGMLAAIGLVLITNGALWTMTLIRAMDPIFRRTINAAALGVLYLPVPADLRDRAREIFEILYSVAFGLFGLLTLWLQTLPAITAMSYTIPLFILGVAWLALLRWTKPRYQQALANSLKKRTLDLVNTTIDLNDETTVHVLIDALKSSDQLYVLHALHLIEAAPNIDWSPGVAPLLDHSSNEVRIAALHYLGRLASLESAAATRVPLGVAERVAQLLTASDEAVQAAAIEAYCAITGAQSLERILPYLSSPNLAIQSAAIVGSSQYASTVAREICIEVIDRWLNSQDINRRCEAIRLIGLLPNLDRADRLIDLWNNPQREVKLAVISAAANLRRPEFQPHLIEALADVRVADGAIAALVHYGAAIEPELKRALSDTHIDRAVRAKIPIVLRRLGTLTSVEILIEHLIDPDSKVRAAVELALVWLHTGHPEMAISPEKLRLAVEAEMQDYYTLYVLEQDLNLSQPESPLADTFRMRRWEMLDRAL